MGKPHITSHAISRYRARVEPVSYAEARQALLSKAVQAAVDFSEGTTTYVRLPGGQRIVIEHNAVVTVLPASPSKPKRVA